MATTDKVRERIEAFARQFSEELSEEMGDVDDSNSLSWLDAVEEQAVEIGDAVVTALVEKHASRCPPVEDEATCPTCDQTGRYRGTRERILITRRGPATVTEPEYFCSCCRKAFFPDEELDRR